MIKNVILTFSLCVMVLLGGCKNDNKQENDKTASLIIGTSADNPPWEYLKDGKIVGFDIALMEEIGKLLNREIKIQDMNFDGILGSLASGRIDGAIAAISATDERKKSVDFSNNYYGTTISMVFLKSNPYKSEKDLSGKTVGVQSGTVYDLYANGDMHKKVEKYEVKALPRIPELIQDLKSQRIAAIIIGSKEAESIVKENSDYSFVPIIEDSGFAIALPKGSSLTDQINSAIETLKSNGTFEVLTKKWLGA